MNWNIVGHQWAENLLQKHIIQDEVRHAYLFSGPKGIGRRTLAVKFAQALNCLEPQAPGTPCYNCRLCKQTESMQHIDLATVKTEEDTNVIKVDQIRDLQRTLSLTPYEAKYRIAFLMNFHEANQNAQNALLKTLEEAPRRVVLLMTTESTESLLPTIVSRCEVLRLRPQSIEHLTEDLHLRQSIPQEEAEQLAHLSGGRFGYAIQLHNQQTIIENHKTYVEELIQLLNSPLRERFSYAEKLSKDKTALRNSFHSWISFWRDLLLLSSNSIAPLTNISAMNELRQLTDVISFQTAKTAIKHLEEGLTLLDSNINPRLLTETILLDWPHL